MIRDPSDGSVRVPHGESPLSRSAPDVRELRAPILETGTSGLPAGSVKSKDIARLEKSREWLREYHLKPKGSASHGATGNGEENHGRASIDRTDIGAVG